jgi:hypothetical protein
MVRVVFFAATDLVGAKCSPTRIPQRGHLFKPSGHWSFQSKTLRQFLQVTLILAMGDYVYRFHNEPILTQIRKQQKAPAKAGRG